MDHSPPMKRFIISCLFLLLAITCHSQTPLIDSLLLQAAKHTRDSNEIVVLDQLSSEFMRSDFARAKSFMWQQIALAKAIGKDFKLSATYSGLMSVYQHENHLDSARYYLDQLAAFSKKNPGDKKASFHYYSASGLFYKNQSKYNQALPFLKQALALVDRKDDQANYAGQLLNIGNTYNSMGEFRNAADYHLKSLTLFEEIKHERGQSFALQSLGNDFYELGQYRTAENYLLRSEKMKTRLGDKRGEMTSWMTLGCVYQQSGRYEGALKYFNHALARSRELKIPLHEGRALFNLGSLAKTMKRFDEARTYLNESMRLSLQAGDSVTVARIKTYLVSLAEDAERMKNHEQSLLDNISISMEKGANTQTAEGHLQLAAWYASQKQFEDAFYHLQKGHQLKDSLTSDAVLVQMKTLEEEHQNEKRERQISLLKKDQELQALALSRQRIVIFSTALALVLVIVIGLLLVNRYRAINKAKRLIEIERVRNNLARDLHDDIGSTLSSINIMSQVALVEKGNPETYLQRIGNQSARIMDDLGDMVWSINPRNDSIEHVVNRMQEFAAEIFEFKAIEYEFKVNLAEGVVLTPEQRKNFFLIFKESINNAAKYSEATFVEITLGQHRNVLGMRVKDNGRGFDERTVREGNGLRNMRDRAKELNGSLLLTSIVRQGTTVELKLPIA